MLSRGGPTSPGLLRFRIPEGILATVAFILLLGCFKNWGQLWERTGLCYRIKMFKQILFLGKVKTIRLSKLDIMKTAYVHYASYFH